MPARITKRENDDPVRQRYNFTFYIFHFKFFIFNRNPHTGSRHNLE